MIRLHAILLLVMVFVFPSTAMAGKLVRRAAFDIGSATVKCKVADVDVALGKIVRVVLEMQEKADFAESLSNTTTGRFDDAIMAKGLSILSRMKQSAVDQGAEAFSAVGTAAFRKARNGVEYFERIEAETSIPARIISQQQEALLGFHAASLLMDVPPDKLLVWDIGGASMQIAVRSDEGPLLFHLDSMASVSFRNVMINVIKKEPLTPDATPNPINAAQARQGLEYVRSYATMHVPVRLARALQRPGMKVAGIGGVHYYSIPGQMGERKPFYTQDDLMLLLRKQLGKTDDQIDGEFATTQVSNIILVLGFMEALDIDTVAPLRINEADGLLIAPEFW